MEGMRAKGEGGFPLSPFSLALPFFLNISIFIPRAAYAIRLQHKKEGHALFW